MDTTAGAGWEAAVKNRDVILLAAVPWEGLRNRSQQLAALFAKQNRVLYVDPPISFLSPFKEASLKERLDLHKEGARQISENLYVCASPPVFPFGNRLFHINALNQLKIGQYLKKVAAGLGMEELVLWTYLPNTADLVGSLGESLLCYDLADEHSAFPHFSKAVVENMERRLLKKADLVFVTAADLRERKKDIRPDMVLVPNGADVRHFQKVFCEDLALPEEMRAFDQPVVGLVGLIEEWVDLELIAYAAEARPDWSFVLIGPVKADTRRLAGLSNVHLLGEKPYKALPGYLKPMSAAVIPFIKNRLTLSVNPIKLYEYMASGKPVVATDLPELRKFSPWIYVADSKESFVKKLEQAIDEDSTKLKKKRLAWAKEHSWERRYQTLCEHIEEALKHRG